MSQLFTSTTSPRAAADTERLASALSAADAVLVGAGAGLSAADGDHHADAVFAERFADFRRARGITDAYSGGFYPFPTPQERWAFWSRNILLQRYESGPGQVYADLMVLVRALQERDGTDTFVLTTNVDHRFQRAGADRSRLFYTQGDYGLFQCPVPCHQATYDNEEQVRAMVEGAAAAGTPMLVPAELVPRCPRCGEVMTTNLRVDATFVQDEGWQAAARRYRDWCATHESGRVVYLELGVGMNTPGIIKYPFWQRTYANPQALYACLGLEPDVPRELTGRSVVLRADLGQSLAALRAALAA
nr:Sir2 silent information regulator family NAD-dependent deacetylase [Actinomyces sp.]